MIMSGTLTLLTVPGDDLRFAAKIAERSIVLDGSDHADEANPVQALLAAIAACEAMDVISILRKKRQVVTAYEVLMSGERGIPSEPGLVLGRAGLKQGEQQAVQGRECLRRLSHQQVAGATAVVEAEREALHVAV